MRLALALGTLLLLSCEEERVRPWPRELSNSTSLVVAWEDLEGPPVSRTITGEELGKVQKFFRPNARSERFKCGFHRDASFTLASGRRVDLCFGCGIADLDGEYAFDAEGLRGVYVELLGPQPTQKNPFPR